MEEYFANFIKTGNPAGLGVPEWPAVDKSEAVPVMHIDVNTRVEQDKSAPRYQVMQQNAAKP